ncbi:MAG: hypothetical protein ABI112_10625 [Terracoccus sp.]
MSEPVAVSEPDLDMVAEIDPRGLLFEAMTGDRCTDGVLTSGPGHLSGVKRL